MTVSAISGNTTEAGGTATFSLVLTSQPTANVSIALSSSNTGEGTLGTSSVTFTTANWSTAQVITVTGVNDFVDEVTDPMPYSIITGACSSSDGFYSGLAVSDVSCANLDNDAAGVTVGGISGSAVAQAREQLFVQDIARRFQIGNVIADDIGAAE